MNTLAVNPDWVKLRSKANTLLSQSVTNLLDPWHEQLKGLFTRQLEHKPPPYKRRPQAALRLWHHGERKLIVHPGWSSWSKRVDLERVDCELLEGKESRLTFGRRWTRSANPELRGVCDTLAWSCQAIQPSVVEDITAALDVIEDYVEDWRAVLARSADHFCSCGRPLTDAISRSRGIGPECIRYFDDQVYQTRSEAHAAVR